jgi:hypothetical protein
MPDLNGKGKAERIVNCLADKLLLRGILDTPHLRRFRCQKQSQLRQNLAPARSCFESNDSPQAKDNEK